MLEKKVHDNTILKYEFQSLNQSQTEKTDGRVQEFVIPELNQFKMSELKNRSSIIKQERQFAEEQSFQISPIVKKFRGIKDQERQDLDDRVNDEVKKRMDQLSSEAYEKGYQAGVLLGQEIIQKQMKEAALEKVVKLENFINQVQTTRQEIVQNQLDEVFELIKTLAKWVTLRELSNDGSYIKRLLEKLILELRTKENLLIMLNKKHFEEMPEILSVVEGRIGKLTNVRLEFFLDSANEGIENHLAENGIVVHSENGILVGTLSEQFNSMDELFKDIDLFGQTENLLKTEDIKE
jgi:flagellar assembly protein FliH